MNAFRTLLAAAALVGASSTAFAAPLTVVDQGEAFSVQHEAGYTSNIVGGGGTVSLTSNGESQEITYANASFAQRTAGIPVFVGGSEGNVAYAPAAPSASLMAAR
jgi:hypothetical protein